MLELGAVASLDPEPRTLRELLWAAEAADRAHWNRTFSVLTQIYNTNRPTDAEPIPPLDFCPWHDTAEPAQAPPPTEADRRLLREFFPPRKV